MYMDLQWSLHAIIHGEASLSSLLAKRDSLSKQLESFLNSRPEREGNRRNQLACWVRVFIFNFVLFQYHDSAIVCVGYFWKFQVSSNDMSYFGKPYALGLCYTRRLVETVQKGKLFNFEAGEIGIFSRCIHSPKVLGALCATAQYFRCSIFLSF